MPHNKANDFHDPNYWMRHAESDLAYACANPKGVLPEHRCFHAQQAAEKALKAVFVAHGMDVRITHFINVLLNDLKVEGVEIPPEVESVRDLTVYATETRYPSVEEIPESRPEEAIQKARAALKWAKKEIAQAQKQKHRKAG